MHSQDLSCRRLTLQVETNRISRIFSLDEFEFCSHLHLKFHIFYTAIGPLLFVDSVDCVLPLIYSPRMDYGR